MSLTDAVPSGAFLFDANGIPRLIGFEVEFGFDPTWLHGYEKLQEAGRLRARIHQDGGLTPEAKALSIEMLNHMRLRRTCWGCIAVFFLVVLIVGVALFPSNEGSNRMVGTVLLAVGALGLIILFFVMWWSACRMHELRQREEKLRNRV